VFIYNLRLNVVAQGSTADSIVDCFCLICTYELHRVTEYGDLVITLLFVFYFQGLGVQKFYLETG
jgi:hypothetical protein